MWINILYEHVCQLHICCVWKTLPGCIMDSPYVLKVDFSRRVLGFCSNCTIRSPQQTHESNVLVCYTLHAQCIPTYKCSIHVHIHVAHHQNTSALGMCTGRLCVHALPMQALCYEFGKRPIGTYLTFIIAAISWISECNIIWYIKSLVDKTYHHRPREWHLSDQWMGDQGCPCSWSIACNYVHNTSRQPCL